MNSNRNLDKLLRVIFPEVLMEYFDISGWHDGSDKIEVWLDEKHYLERSDYKSGTVISHGFTDEKVIQDFPLRGKPVYLHVRRRRWYDKATGETFSYTYDDLTAEGTKYIIAQSRHCRIYGELPYQPSCSCLQTCYHPWLSGCHVSLGK